MSQDDHYLKSELYELVRKDPAIFEFLQPARWTASGTGTSSGRTRSG